MYKFSQAKTELFWADKCDMPLGLEDRRVPHQMMRASSYYNTYCAPRNARLHQRRAGRDGGAWCAKKSNRGQWVQVDFSADTLVRRVATQGRQNADQWVTSYYLSFSRDGHRFAPYKEGRSTKVSIAGAKWGWLVFLYILFWFFSHCFDVLVYLAVKFELPENILKPLIQWNLDVRLRWSLTGRFTNSNLADGGTNRDFG